MGICTELWTNDDRLNRAAANKAVNLLISQPGQPRPDAQ